MARNVRRVLGCLLLLGLPSGSLLAGPPATAFAAAGAPVSVLPGMVGGARAESSPGSIEQEPTRLQLEAQHAQLVRLRAEAGRRAAGVDDAQQALQGAAVLAGQALEAYALAVRALHARQQDERYRQDTLTRAQSTVDTRRQELGRWARQAYTTGSGIGASVTVTTLLLADDAEDLGTTLTTLSRIGRGRTRALIRMQAARARADAAADAAATASDAAADAAVEASAAKDASEQAVRTQRRLLGLAESSLAQSNDEVSAATAREAGLRAALLSPVPAGGPGTGSGASRDNRVTGQVGECTGAAVEQYPNGQIPISALCPLRSAGAHYLRADAAFAFDRMGQAYAHRFGAATCITDSYRSYAAQVSLFARKPALAAVPGTSNHGWGTAVDLCGGIQRFDSPQHRWMIENAPLYGWFHPGWAQQNGSKPEPWHWEYGG